MRLAREYKKRGGIYKAKVTHGNKKEAKGEGRREKGRERENLGQLVYNPQGSERRMQLERSTCKIADHNMHREKSRELLNKGRGGNEAVDKFRLSSAADGMGSLHPVISLAISLYQ